MSAEIRHLHRPHLPAILPRVPSHGRLAGLGSVFGKSLRDNRVAMVLVAAILGLMTVVGGYTMTTTYGTPETRLELAAMSADLPPIMRGLYGNPVNVDTLGGFVSWHYAAYFALFVGLWSILALSSTLAGEARRGTMDFTLATPLSRRSVAFQKLAGHVAALVAVCAFLAVTAWVVGAAFGTMDRDAIAPGAAVAFAVGVGLRGLVAGAVAFALAPLVGRGIAAGVAGSVLVAAYVVNSYRSVVPVLDTLANLSWFSWTGDHLPLAGRYDWPALGLVGLVAAAFLAVGVEAFARRDVGVTLHIPIPGMPAALLGVRGPFGRSLGDLLPSALAWGLGLGTYGLVMAASSRPVTETFASSPGLAEAVKSILPGMDITSAAGFLQLAFVDLGFVLVGLVAATFVAGRASDETAGRLELQLATPLSRARWALASGIAVGAAIAVVSVLLAVAIGAGVAWAGDDPVNPAVGTLVLAAYGTALAGVGIAVGGLVRASVAMPVVLALAIGTFLLDLLAPALPLPDWVRNLALTSHLGQPMIGEWALPGIVASLALAVGGLAVGAWGMSRRDVGT
jgi:ABC-2 type transport system permease protein